MRKWAWSCLTAARERQPDRSVETVVPVAEAAAGIAGSLGGWESDTGALETCAGRRSPGRPALLLPSCAAGLLVFGLRLHMAHPATVD